MSKDPHLTNRKRISIEWGDCDPAQIVYFPRYFAFFDNCTTALFKKAGLVKREMLKQYGIIGIPIVEVQASFRAPSRFSDEVEIVSHIRQFRRSSFLIQHQLFNGGVLSVECLETRVWARRSPNDPERIESTPIPAEVIARFSGPSQSRGAQRNLRAKKK
ncbi:MAG TPA: thioesterase family protein [Candidatus Sulfotelmatobacter sp.]|nr:thioesterase family protein [Candidatus Sulfotelmatobacter sp.]